MLFAVFAVLLFICGVGSVCADLVCYCVAVTECVNVVGVGSDIAGVGAVGGVGVVGRMRDVAGCVYVIIVGCVYIVECVDVDCVL